MDLIFGGMVWILAQDDSEIHAIFNYSLRTERTILIDSERPGAECSLAPIHSVDSLEMLPPAPRLSTSEYQYIKMLQIELSGWYTLAAEPFRRSRYSCAA
jgi:hypothetical protein